MDGSSARILTISRVTSIIFRFLHSLHANLASIPDCAGTGGVKPFLMNACRSTRKFATAGTVQTVGVALAAPAGGKGEGFQLLPVLLVGQRSVLWTGHLMRFVDGRVVGVEVLLVGT